MFQKKKGFLSAKFAEDTKVTNTYPSKFLNTLEVSGMPSTCLFVRLSSLGVRGVRVNTPFIIVFQKKKDFLGADSIEDTEVGTHTLPSSSTL
jgi:hypothetical protein